MTVTKLLRLLNRLMTPFTPSNAWMKMNIEVRKKRSSSLQNDIDNEKEQAFIPLSRGVEWMAKIICTELNNMKV